MDDFAPDGTEDDEIEFQSCEYVETQGELPYEIIRRVFRVDAVITDESSLDDFICSTERDKAFGRTPTASDIWSVAGAHERIQEEYGVDVRPETRIWRIAEKIGRVGPNK